MKSLQIFPKTTPLENTENTFQVSVRKDTIKPSISFFEMLANSGEKNAPLMALKSETNPEQITLNQAQPLQESRENRSEVQNKDDKGISRESKPAEKVEEEKTENKKESDEEESLTENLYVFTISSEINFENKVSVNDVPKEEQTESHPQPILHNFFKKQEIEVKANSEDVSEIQPELNEIDSKGLPESNLNETELKFEKTEIKNEKAVNLVHQEKKIQKVSQEGDATQKEVSDVSVKIKNDSEQGKDLKTDEKKRTDASEKKGRSEGGENLFRQEKDSKSETQSQASSRKDIPANAYIQESSEVKNEKKPVQPRVETKSQLGLSETQSIQSSQSKQGDTGGFSGGGNDQFSRMFSGLNQDIKLNSNKEAKFENAKPEGLDVRKTFSELVQQAKIQILDKEKSQATIELNPREYGKLTLKVHVDKNVVGGTITVESEAVKNSIEGHMESLRSELAQAGLSLEKLNVEVKGEFTGTLAQDQGAKKEEFSSEYTDGNSKKNETEENELEYAGVSYRRSQIEIFA